MRPIKISNPTNLGLLNTMSNSKQAKEHALIAHCGVSPNNSSQEPKIEPC
jgi:hypothetical protein